MLFEPARQRVASQRFANKGVGKLTTTEKRAIDAHRTALGYGILGAFVIALGTFMILAAIYVEAIPPVTERIVTAQDAVFGIAFTGKHGCAVGRYGMIFHTYDGGKNWQRQSLDIHRPLTDIAIGDPQHMFAVGANGTILATDDGADTWKQQKSGVDAQLLGVRALSPKDVFVVGAFGTLLSTADGGSTWRKHELAWERLIPKVIEDVGPVVPNLNSVYFVSAKSGWVVGEFGLILHTDDGGETWTTQRYDSKFPQLVAVYFRNALDGWAAGQSGILLHTTDGGAHWTAVDVGVKRGLYAIALEDGSRGVVVGDGIVLLTKDGGSTWNRLSVPGNVLLSDVVAMGDRAFAVGPRPALLPINFDASN